MMRWKQVFAAIFVLGLGQAHASAEAGKPGEQILIRGMEAFRPGGALAASMGHFSTVQVTGQSFEQAVCAQTAGSPANRWDLMLQAPVESALSQGDLLLVRFWARTREAMAAEGIIGLAVELNREPWEKLGEGQYGVSRQWTQIQLPLLARRAFDAGVLNVNLRLGYPSQTLEIGGLELMRMPAGTRFDTLPRTAPLGYHGMESDAPWRYEALKRIDRIRKADIKIILLDPEGKPAPNRTVHVSLTKHAFHFGTAVDAAQMLADSQAAVQYREQIVSSFNTVVYENDLKWLSISRDPHRLALVDQTLSWLAERNIDVRGHVLVWPAMKWLPPEIVALKDDSTALRNAVNEHITALVGRYQGRLKEWDVLNEPYNNRDLESILGREAFVDWFKSAHAADPQARLFINDFGILESNNRLDTEHQKYYEEMIQFLLSHGAPLDAIGIQGHFGATVTDPEKMLAILDRFGRFGKPICITELDVNLLDPQMQANFLRDVFIVCFSHPGVDGVLQWGFWEGRHWLPEAAPYARNWDLRPHGQAWKALMQQWSTDATVVTGTDGTATLRGFLGEYLFQSGSTSCHALLTAHGSRVQMLVDP